MPNGVAVRFASRFAHRRQVSHRVRGVIVESYHAELRSRFGGRFTVVKDRRMAQGRRRSLDLGSKPFETAGR